MESIWNDARLLMPPLVTVPVKKIKFDVFDLRTHLQDAIDFYECQVNFHKNSILCSHLIAKRKHSFRNFKGFQHVCKANVALRRLARVDLPNILSNFIGLIPDSAFTLELPPKVNLDYVLMRIIASYKLLERICDCCKYAVSYFVRLLRHNFFVDILSLFLSVLSKIWYDGNIMAKFTATLYCYLKNYLEMMPKNKKNCFDGFSYPNELTGNFLKEFEAQQSIQINVKEKVNKYNIKMIETAPKQIKSRDFHRIVEATSDLGEVVSRDSFFSPSHIKTNDEIQKFLIDEDVKRRKYKETSLTKNISNEEWLKIKTKILHKISCGKDKKAYLLFKKKILDKVM